MKIQLRVAMLATALVVGVSSAQADVIDFEGGLDASFTYIDVNEYSSGCSACFAGTGYQSVLDATASNGAVFNPDAASPAAFTWNQAGTFDLTSLVIAGAWGNQTLTIQGWSGGLLVQSAGVAVTPAAIVFAPGWVGLDEFRILTDPAGYTDTVDGGSGQHWALDNLTINQNAVPEPATLLLLVTGVTAAAYRRRPNA